MASDLTEVRTAHSWSKKPAQWERGKQTVDTGVRGPKEGLGKGGGGPDPLSRSSPGSGKEMDSQVQVCLLQVYKQKTLREGKMPLLPSSRVLHAVRENRLPLYY